ADVRVFSFFFSSRRRHTRFSRDWSSDVCSSDLLLRRTRDFTEVEGDGSITREIADRALNALDVDEHGLDEMDARILLTLIEKFGGDPTGLGNLAVSVGEDPGTIEEVYEPYLIQEAFLERTPRGRIATARAYRHFGLPMPGRPAPLFE